MTSQTSQRPETSARDSATLDDGSILSVRDLRVSFPTHAGRARRTGNAIHSVRGVSFEVRKGEVLGIVGESGSGKSVTATAIMGLLPGDAEVSGSIRLDGGELLGLGDKELSTLRGSRMSMVFQDPLSALTPVYTIGYQLIEAIRVHRPGISERDAARRAAELLDLVGIPSAHARLKAFPHEFSGGMRQRVVIAMAIANDPDLIICDEPTTALDVTIQAQILDVLATAREETGAGIVMITHDLGVVAGLADRVVVMYAGRAVESGEVAEVYRRPRMPYTMGLLGSIPRIDSAGARAPLVPIEGAPPAPADLPPGCPFAPRCPMATRRCEQAPEPELTQGADGRWAACLYADRIAAKDLTVADVYPVPRIRPNEHALIPREQREPVLEVTGLVKHHPLMPNAIRSTTRAASGSASASRGHSLWSRDCWCSTSRSQPSTSRSRRASSTCWRSSRAGSGCPTCSSRTTWPWCGTSPTGSRSCTSGGSSNWARWTNCSPTRAIRIPRPCSQQCRSPTRRRNATDGGSCSPETCRARPIRRAAAASGPAASSPPCSTTRTANAAPPRSRS